MKKLHKISIVLLTGLLIGISCTDNLMLSPISSITSGSFWKTQNDAQGGITGMYDLFRDIADEQLFNFGEARAEELTGGRWNRTRIVYENALTPLEPGYNWYNIYRIVHHTNLILKYVPDIQFNIENDKNRILAEAHTMRAFCYFVLAKTWGDAILITEPTENYGSSMYKERTSVGDVFTLIKDDINKAISLFPDNNYPSGRNRWSKSGANALKADIYLWTGKRMNGGEADITTALNALNEIKASDVTLLPNFENVFDHNNKGNKEIIMAINYNQTETGNNYFWTFYTGELPANIPAETLAKVGVLGGTNYYVVKTSTIDKFSDDDSRKEATFLDIYGTDNANNPTIYVTSINMKFKGTIDAGTRRFTNDIIIYRYADILLMIAEAKNALGQDPTAEINEIRKRAYKNKYNDHLFVKSTKEQNDAAILAERGFELLFEGKRWWDLVRFGKAIEMTSLSTGEDWRIIWPIGADVLSREPKVIQNPGYTY